MKTYPWHSVQPNSHVYHDELGCTEGNNIESKYRRIGTAGRRKCDTCRRIG